MNVEANTIGTLQKWQIFALNVHLFYMGMRIVVTVLKTAGV